MAANGRPVRVLFLLQRPEAWINVASVWSAMHEDADFEPVVWLLPYNDCDPSLSARRAPEARSLLDAKGVPYVEWRDSMRLENGEYHVAIFIHPYDRERPAPLWFSRVAAAIPYTIYIPYGMPMGGGRKNLRLQYAQPTQINASAVVARSAFEKAQYARHCPAGDQHVHVLGHPRFDILIEALGEPVPSDMATFCGNRMVLLWSSHFSFGRMHSQTSNFSTFDLIGPELFEYALENRNDICLLWRPHPGLLPTLIRDGLISERELPLLRAEFNANGILLDERPGHAPAFRASDALISDIGSFLVEYLVTGKPVLALKNPEGEPLNEEGESLVAHLSRASTPAEVERFIAGVSTGALVQPLGEARAAHLPILDGAAGRRVTDLAKSLIDRHAANTGVLSDFSDDVNQWRPKDVRHQSSRLNDQWNFRSAPTPILDKLCEALRQIRRAKSRESHFRKRARRHFNFARAWVTEMLKQQSSTGFVLGLVRRGRRAPPR